jgi:hypothetical protein
VSGGVWGIFALMVFGYGEVVVMVVGKDVCNSVGISESLEKLRIPFRITKGVCRLESFAEWVNIMTRKGGSFPCVRTE